MPFVQSLTLLLQAFSVRDHLHRYSRGADRCTAAGSSHPPRPTANSTSTSNPWRPCTDRTQPRVGPSSYLQPPIDGHSTCRSRLAAVPRHRSPSPHTLVSSTAPFLNVRSNLTAQLSNGPPSLSVREIVIDEVGVETGRDPFISPVGKSQSVMATTRHSRRSREGRPPEITIGRYTRLDEIGRGSFATVYQGVHTVCNPSTLGITPRRALACGACVGEINRTKSFLAHTLA